MGDLHGLSIVNLQHALLARLLLYLHIMDMCQD